MSATRVRPGEYDYRGFKIVKRGLIWLIFDLSDPAPYPDYVSLTTTKSEAMRLVNGWADARDRAAAS